jgi:hypothetical protein
MVPAGSARGTLAAEHCDACHIAGNTEMPTITTGVQVSDLWASSCNLTSSSSSFKFLYCLMYYFDVLHYYGYNYYNFIFMSQHVYFLVISILIVIVFHYPLLLVFCC